MNQQIEQNSAPNQNQQSVNITPEVKSHSSSKFPLFLLGGLVLVMIFVAGYKLLANTSSVPQIPQPSPTPDWTENWETYNDSNGDFTLQYPSGWNIETECGQDGYICFTSPDFIASQFGMMGSPPKRGVLISVNLRETMLDVADGFCQYGDKEYMAGCKSINVAGYPGWQRQTDENTLMTEVSFQDSKNILSINAIYSDDNQQKTINALNQILSTFQFLN